jgi:hypothetical protein
MRLVAWLFAIVLAYGVAWMSDAAIGDPCLEAGRETDRLDYVQRWLPPRTDCRVTSRAGETRIEKGSSEVSLTMFALTLVLAAAVLSRVRIALRAGTALVACAAAVLVIFLV